jgi:hypothetical protein
MSTIQWRDGNQTLQPYATSQDSGGSNYARVVTAARAVISQTPTVTASSAYSSGNEVGGLLTFANAAAGDELIAGTIDSLILTDKSGNASAYDLWLFDSNPSATTFTDKTALTINAADIVRSLGFIQILTTSWSAAGTGGAIAVVTPKLRFVLASTTSLYGALIARGTPPTFGSTSALQVRIAISKN